MTKLKNNNIVSLFTGAGGLDLGFKMAGFHTIWANEYDKNIWGTFEKNFPNVHLNKEPIQNIKMDDIPQCDGIIGGPPCQSFSEAGAKKGTTDPRGQLFWNYIEILKAKKPLFFVAENVSGLLAERHSKDLNGFITAFKNAGYKVSVNIFNAKFYGVPQDRERLIIVGYRNDLNKVFTPPVKVDKILTLRDTIADIANPIETKGGITNNCLLNNEYMTGGFSPMFMSRNRVRSWDETSFTILATARQIPIHPDAPKMIKVSKDKFKFVDDAINKYRRLSVRECARIQTFPDSFTFVYDKIENAYKMIGNAVPVELAYHIGKKIMLDITNDLI